MTDLTDDTGNTTLSKIVTTIGYAALVGMLGTMIDYQAQVQAFLVNVSPDWADPIVIKAWAYFLALIMLFVGPNRKKPAEVSKYYRK
jgi:hypothetical protein